MGGPSTYSGRMTAARRAAQDAGDKVYHGDPCEHGHDSGRYSSSGQCVACAYVGARRRAAVPGTREHAVVEHIRQHGPLTRRQIAEALGMPMASVKGITTRCRGQLETVGEVEGARRGHRRLRKLYAVRTVAAGGTSPHAS